MSQATLSRLVRSAGPDLLVVGRARATRYAWRRPIEQVDAPVAVYEVGRRGERAREVARLHPVLPRGYVVEALAKDLAGGWAEEPPLPQPGDDPSAWQAAVAFWEAVSADQRVSAPFRDVASRNAGELRALRPAFELLPLRSPVSPR